MAGITHVDLFAEERRYNKKIAGKVDYKPYKRTVDKNADLPYRGMDIL